MKCSWSMFHAAPTDQKVPYLLLAPKREEPSRLTLAETE